MAQFVLLLCLFVFKSIIVSFILFVCVCVKKVSLNYFGSSNCVNYIVIKK